MDKLKQKLFLSIVLSFMFVQCGNSQSYTNPAKTDKSSTWTPIITDPNESPMSSIESNKTDIAYLINTFISNCSDGYVSWGLYNNNKNIEKYDTNIVSGNISSYQLRFNGYLTMNGEAIFKDDAGNTGEWRISLNGPRAGANILYIGSLMLYTHPSFVCDYLKKKFLMSEYRIIENSELNYSCVFKVKGFYLKLIYDMGTYSGTISIYISKDINEIINID